LRAQLLLQICDFRAATASRVGRACRQNQAGADTE
jgi:hypothetical protein